MVQDRHTQTRSGLRNFLSRTIPMLAFLIGFRKSRISFFPSECVRAPEERSTGHSSGINGQKKKKQNSKTTPATPSCVHSDTRTHSTVSSHEPCPTSCDRSYIAMRLFFSLFPRFPSIRKEIRKQRTRSFCHVTHQPTNTQEKHQWPSKPLDSALRTKSFKREMKRN